ncbi:MAG: tRNA (adenosine(37)-N6)-threonylcarbamoyltransferase complex ATPase subunit type 1 TsaE [Bacteroidota bacterium]|nr:tRNA (adenosine(37)-N6)-threonylcarbamoyltransferase complex ATPase subunit type 1 TsaE [Bacteroidota bacterium]
MNYNVENLDAITGIAKTFLKDFPSSRIFAFHGELGAGKTTFIKALCAELGVKDAMSSPSFSLVNEYHDAKENPVYHFDLYRLKSPEEAFDIGMEEYLYSGNYCFVEWPERAGEIFPEETVHVTIREIAGKREISVDLKI